MGLHFQESQNMNNEELYDELKAKIQHINEYVWDNKLKWSDVEAWLHNFIKSDNPKDDEHIQMLYLLSQFMYFSKREMRELLTSVYRDNYKYRVIEGIRKNNQDTTDSKKIKNLYEEELNRTRFLGVGNPSESGTHLLYYFRQETGLKKDLFINSHEIMKREGDDIVIRDKSIKQYIFIDDLCGSGDQVCRYSKDIVTEIKRLNPEAVVSYFVLFAMSDGIAKVKNDSAFDFVDAVYTIDNTFKCFGTESRHYKNVSEPISRIKAENISMKYGKKLLASDPLGYSNCQLLFGFNHNTPNNTLPIIWYNEKGSNWTPIFKRYDKNYGWGH